MSKGISTVIIIIIVVAVIGIVAVSFQSLQPGIKTPAIAKTEEQPQLEEKQQLPQEMTTSQPKETQTTTSKTLEGLGKSGCSGAGVVSFVSPPRRLEDIEIIEPIGLINANSGHVTPTDHGYYYPPNWKPQDNPAEFKDVLAPADGIITTIQLVGNRQGDYRLIIHHTCTFYTIYIHLKELSPKISQSVGEFTSMTKNTNIPVTAGEVIGRANSFDFSVHDDNVVLKGFIVPEHYYPETWKIHTVDMFAYFEEPIKSQLLAKNIRETEPRAGKIDYDIDGRLAGNWFVENTNGYEGTESNRNQGRYWATHLTFTYNGIDPSLIIVGMGDFNGESREFAVKGNSPDPSTVSMSTGVVEYELVNYDYITGTGQYWDRLNYAKGVKAIGTDKVEGVILAQMIDDGKIKFEVFSGKSASEVTGFSNTVIYER